MAQATADREGAAKAPITLVLGQLVPTNHDPSASILLSLYGFHCFDDIYDITTYKRGYDRDETIVEWRCNRCT